MRCAQATFNGGCSYKQKAANWSTKDIDHGQAPDQIDLQK